MEGCGDAWMQEYNEAVKLGEDIAAATIISQPDFFASKAKILIFGTTIDTLQFHLRESTEIDEELMNDRKNMIADLRSKMKELMNAYMLDLQTNNANDNTTSTAAAVLHLHRQTITAQDEELEKLLETIKRTTDVAWAINQEFRLHQTLTADANKYVEVPDSRLQEARKRFAILNRSTRCGCSCLWLLLLSLTGILLLVALIYMLIKYL